MLKKSLLMFLLALTSAVCLAQETAMDVLLTPDIGGIKQAIEIKTDDASKPVLLFLSGGPGSSMMNNAARYTTVLKTRFTIVQWDQRDAGKTLKLNPSPNPPTLAQMTDDTRQVVEFVRKTLRQEKIYLLGSSWGNVLGFDMVKNHPDWLHAYFAVNPVVSQMDSENELLQTLKAQLKDNADASDELAKVNPPFNTAQDMFYLRKWLFYKEGKTFVFDPEFKAFFGEWSKTWSSVWTDVMRIDLRKSLATVQCPVYFFVGKNDIQTSTGVAIEYFEKLHAPRKQLFLFENSGHQIHQEEAEKFQQMIIGILDANSARQP